MIVALAVVRKQFPQMMTLHNTLAGEKHFVIYIYVLFSLLIYNTAKCMKTHFKNMFAGYPHIIYNVQCLHEINDVV